MRVINTPVRAWCYEMEGRERARFDFGNCQIEVVRSPEGGIEIQGDYPITIRPGASNTVRIEVLSPFMGDKA